MIDDNNSAWTASPDVSAPKYSVEEVLSSLYYTLLNNDDQYDGYLYIVSTLNGQQTKIALNEVLGYNGQKEFDKDTQKFLSMSSKFNINPLLLGRYLIDRDILALRHRGMNDVDIQDAEDLYTKFIEKDIIKVLKNENCKL